MKFLGRNEGQAGILIVIGIVVAIFLFMLLNPIVIISAGHRGVVTQFGAVQDGIMGEGIHWRTPFIQAVKKINVQIQKEEATTECASKDMQTVTSKIAVNYRIDPSQVAKLYQTVGMDFSKTIIDPAIQESVKATTSKYTAEELIVKREQVSHETRTLLALKLQPYGIIVDNYNILNFAFSAEFNKAVEEKQTAEQSALKAKRDLDRIKVEAEQKIATARAEAESLKVKKQEITPALLQLEWIKKWNGVMPTYSGGNSSMMFNLPVQNPVK